MRIFSALFALALLSCATSPVGRAHTTVSGYGLTLALPAGWHGLVAPGQLQAADFPLSRTVLASAERARVPRGHLHLIIWDYGPSVPYLTFPAARAPLQVAASNLTPAPLEGFPATDTYAVRTATLNDELIEVIADFGPGPLSTNRLQQLNQVLGTLRVTPPRVLLPRQGRLAWRGVALRLLPGWSGRIEIPANQHAAQFVFRLHHAHTGLVLVEMPGAGGGHLNLPITLTANNILHAHGREIARRVFSTAGRSFDLSVQIDSVHDLADANRLLNTLTAAPRSWTFAYCDLTLRLPGTWHAAINPRTGCFPIITLYAPNFRVLITELHRNERSTGRILHRSGRRFRVNVLPPAEQPKADAVLATLHAQPRR